MRRFPIVVTPHNAAFGSFCMLHQKKTMALRQIVSKLAMPAFEKDLARAMTSELAQAEHMVDCMLAPQVFAYAAPRTTGAFQQSAQVQAPVSKVEIFIKKEGLFQDAPSWHK